ncbi:unnamed protein product [Closterium sp. Naga37s-1]|nr:unnamed protein product [Closterium sp. Naga37s-1]
MDPGVSAPSAAASRPIDHSKWDQVGDRSDKDERESGSQKEEVAAGRNKSEPDREGKLIPSSSGCSKSESPCLCCFNRVLGTQGKLALAIPSLNDFRRHLLQQLPKSIPLASPDRQGLGRPLGGDTGDNAAREGAKVRAEKQKGAAEMGAAGGVGEYRPESAPHLCAEAMLLEWMAEPRVGVLMDLGRIRTLLLATVAATDAPALASFTGLFAPIVEELGAHRQGEKDIMASVLVQVLGVKGGEEKNDGFKAHVLPLLPGGAEAHRESEGGAGEDRGKGGIADGGRKGRNAGKREAGRKGGRRGGEGDGGAGSSGEWRQGLEGPVWDRSGTLPEPLLRQGSSWEWEELPAGDEAAIKLADDVQGRILYKKIFENVYRVIVD